MNYKRLGLAMSAFGLLAVCGPVTAEIQRPSAAGAPSPETSYQHYIEQIQKAATPDQLPSFSHNSPLNKIKLADTKEEEKEVMAMLKEMTPKSFKQEGRIEFGDRTYLFLEGDPSSAAKNGEYFPLTVEMIKEEGQWKLRRQQSFHIKNGSVEAQVIPKGQPRINRFQELLSAVSRPIGNQPAIGDVMGKRFKPVSVHFMPRDHYFKLKFVDGQREISLYVREGLSFAEIQNRHFVINPMDGYECDLMPDQLVFAPYAGRISFGKADHGFIPGTISMSVRTPAAINLNGTFVCGVDEDAFSPDEEEKAQMKKHKRGQED